MEPVYKRRCCVCGTIDNMLWHHQPGKNQHYCGACYSAGTTATETCRQCKGEKPLPFINYGKHPCCLQCYRKSVASKKERLCSLCGVHNPGDWYRKPTDTCGGVCRQCHKQMMLQKHTLTLCEECLKPRECITMSDTQRCVCNYCFVEVKVREKQQEEEVALTLCVIYDHCSI